MHFLSHDFDRRKCSDNNKIVPFGRYFIATSILITHQRGLNHISQPGDITRDIMPGIFSSSIASNRPGFSCCGSFVKSDVRRTRRLGSSIPSSKYSSGTSRTESSHSTVDDVDRTLRSIHLYDCLTSQESDGISNDFITISAPTRSIHRDATSQVFYANKEHNAMFFSNVPEDNCNAYDRTQTRRQFQPSPSPCPCEWGYFVDTE